ncbi:nephrocystin-3-like [Corticium candelabrum]|uniref:nephrocystin-3-like n=1 Tax=Corticium candelabrum TaxID=121492 RepID=UPI002E268802|nr:nephrocystin-3-like [Corticium candelabrum]
MADAYGHFKKAEHLCEGRLALVKRIDSQQMDKDKLLISLIDVGKVRIKLSNPQEAERPLKEALEMSRECGGQIEPSIHYYALSFMADCYRDLRQFETSEQLYLELLEYVEQQELGQGNVYRVLNNLAWTYQVWGNVSAAIENYEKSLSLMRKQSNVNPLDLSAVITNLASRYEQNGQLERAVSYYEKALAIIRKELPPSHPSLARVMSSLSSCYLQQDRMDRAMPLANEALQRASSSLPINHAELGDYLQEAALCHRDSRSYDEAIRLYERAAYVYSHHLPVQATSLSTVKHNLSVVYNDIGQKDKAVELMTESLNIKIQTLPEKHPDIAKSLVTLGGILRSKGDFDEAVVHIESGLSILREKLPTSPFIADGLYHLAFIEMKRNQLVEAHSHATGCLRLRQQIFRNKHTMIVEAQDLVDEIDKKQQ